MGDNEFMIKFLNKLYLGLLYWIRGPRLFDDGETVQLKDDVNGRASFSLEVTKLKDVTYGRVLQYNERPDEYYIDISLGARTNECFWIKRKGLIKLSDEEKVAYKVMAS